MPCMLLIIRKPNKPIPVAPLKHIPACGESLSEMITDCIGPLPKAKVGNKYWLTIMCKATRFPEAIPLHNIKAPKIVNSHIKFYTFVGLSRSVQSDQGSNLMSGLSCLALCNKQSINLVSHGIPGHLRAFPSGS